MDQDQDLYQDPDRTNRPVPRPRIQSNPGSESGPKPGLGPDLDSDGLKDSREEIRGRDLFQKWRSLEKEPDPEPGPGPGSRPKAKPWTRPGLRAKSGRSTEETRTDPEPAAPRPAPPPRPRSLGSESSLRSEPGPEPESLKSDTSMYRNLDFRRTDPEPGTPRPAPTPQPRIRPEPSLRSEPGPEPQSLKSDTSMYRNLDFRRAEPKPELLQNKSSIHRDLDLKNHLDPIFKRLEEELVSFVKQQLKKLQKILTSDLDLEPDQDQDQRTQAVLSLTLDFLKTMDQEQLADLLLTKTRGSVCQGQMKRLVAERFSHVFEGVAKAGDSAPLTQIYTELYITEGGASEVNQEHEVRHMETTSRRPAAPETTITCEDLFKPRPHSPEPIRVVLTKGVAGVGKTVLTQKFSLDWAEGRAHQDLQLLFPFTFRDLNVLRDTQFSLVELLQHFFSPSKDLCSFQQLQVLFIFDGLDECRPPLDFSRTRVLTDPTESTSVHVLLVNLIRGNLLPSARLWITTRPAAANQIPAECISMMTEVRGFTDPQKEQYFRKKFRDEATAVISHIKSIRSLHIMCHIPIFCWILSTVLQKLLEKTEEPELPRTLTQMYVHFLVVQAKVQNIKYHHGSGADLHWTPETREMVRSLAKLAFEQLQKGNLIFYECDLSECGLDAAAASVYSEVFTQVFRDEPGLYQDKVYCFIHLSVQEFLAALHVHLTFFSSGENLLVEDGSESLDPALFYKTAVETCVRRPNGHLDLFLRFLLGLSLPANQSLLRGLMSPTGSEATNKETARYLQKKVSEELKEELSTERVLNLFYCLSEMQDHSLVQQVQGQLRSGVLDQAWFSSAQWAALVFLLLTSDRDLDLFDLRKFCPSEDALLHLLPVLQASTRAMLGGCHLSERSCSALGSALVRSGLKELDLSNNDLEDCGVKQLCEGLKSDTCKLQVLRLSLCHLSERSCSALGSALVRSGLKELDLSNNDLEDCGVQQLCEGLKSDTCELQVLRLSGCIVTQSGCSSLAAALCLNPSHLQELDLSFNHPGTFGTETLKALREDPHYSLHTLTLEPQSVWWKMPGLTKYSCELKFDLTTANFELKVLEKKPEVQFTEEQQKYPQHPQRFDWYPQILCSVGPGPDRGLSGRSYWEVEWKGGVAIAVTDRSIRRRGDDRRCVFGFNDISWRLWCSEGRYAVCHDSKQQVLSQAPQGGRGRVGVFLDLHAGALSFYEVKADTKGDRRTHLHTFYGRFTQNLIPAIGFGLRSYGSVAYLCGEYHELLV